MCLFVLERTHRTGVNHIEVEHAFYALFKQIKYTFERVLELNYPAHFYTAKLVIY